ncbi:tRNA-uridine aminocarboxypropyltransferase 1 isoform X1 [Tachysurus vachellii]|uniref:tRNA-uridine aminocarboxypropyltransferase 1 isoform X1 n=1 Tax=Tachysurus vachellii TaxID=175792 RepID=UPI00296AEBA0|nr:tRNA-uridine aminocarboxypropyltransferase 1 isoform X1 [Tachysurus vachellii]XP_060734470.1 tRNA-uridine aminocarboxypropyltransferase 1 isoform X1 [Tachysurus vachellii]
MSQTGQDLGKNVKKDHGLADGSGDSVKKKNEEDDDEDPLQGLVLSPHTVLDEAHHTGRLKCSTCGSSRLLYCYTCCCLVGLNPQLIPNIKLPVKIDIIKHPNETDGKSTAVHAKLIAPEDVSIYTYPCIPELDTHTHNVVLVFPGPNSMTVQEMVDYIRKNRRKRGAEKSAEERDTKKPKLEETSDSSQSHSHTHSHTHSGTQMSQNTQQTEDHMCQVQRVIFIDSTWNQTTKIISDERLQDFPRVELKSRKTCFWRHQRGSPDSYLATIEAIYYFLKDFHIHCLQREYRGEYDNLLFFYTFLHKLIRKAKQSTV